MIQGDENVSVAAVIAAYNPDPTIVEVFRAVSKQVNLVVIVDDQSDDSALPIFDELRALGADVVHASENGGIAKTLNIGVARSAELAEPEYFLTLDQDSVPDSNYVSNALETIRHARQLDLSVGFVSAASYNNSPVLGNGTLRGLDEPFDPWQSGMLIPRSTFELVGGLDERLFIDGVDSEFTLRVRKAGLVVLCGFGCNMSHSLGQQSMVSFWGRKRLFTYHSPVRVYYISRNNLIILFRYLLVDPVWVTRKFCYELINHARRVLLSKNKVQVSRAMLIGARDALLLRTGSIKDADRQKLNQLDIG